jgi:hypothetical protein
MNLDMIFGYHWGYIWIWKDKMGYLIRISFLGYNLKSYPDYQKISYNILSYPFIPFHIHSYPKISAGANSQMRLLGQLRPDGNLVEPVRHSPVAEAPDPARDELCCYEKAVRRIASRSGGFRPTISIPPAWKHGTRSLLPRAHRKEGARSCFFMWINSSSCDWSGISRCALRCA